MSVLEFWKSDLKLPDFVTIIPTSTKIDQVKVNIDKIHSETKLPSEFVEQDGWGWNEILWNTSIWVFEIQISEKIWGGFQEWLCFNYQML